MALKTGVMNYQGQFVHQPRVQLRPGPSASFAGRVYSATVSPESAQIMARLGTGVLIIPQKPLMQISDEVAGYRDTYRQAIGAEPPSPIVAGWTFVDNSADRAEEMARRWIGRYWDSVIAHYEFDKPHLKSTPGYEFHGLMYDRLTAPGGAKKMSDFYVGLQPWGTPDQVIEKIVAFANLIGSDAFVGVFRYGGMSPEDGEANMRLFARAVLPELKSLAPAGERLPTAS
jgi:alkanesulfonate monooxygenase SsuD/methylene tetrahydromethanopterin reductase-like flavin-dependent oxidoreductase (luciferase family)